MTENGATTRAGMPRWLLKVLVLILGLGGFLAGLIWLGRMGLERVREHDRYTFAFKDVECAPPPGQQRGDFLDEVQYLTGLPDRLNLLDEKLAQRLTEAFARHPWVEEVKQVEVAGRLVRARLVYRVPVLAVKIRGDRAGDGENRVLVGQVGSPGTYHRGRAVDGHGSLLPKSAPLRELPYLANDVPPPAGPVGVPWGDKTVLAGARTAGFLLPYRDRFRIAEVEVGKEGLVLRAGNNRILWGGPPGEELPGEASAAAKVQRLLDVCKRDGRLGGPGAHTLEYDVRSRELAIRRLLPVQPPHREVGGER